MLLPKFIVHLGMSPADIGLIMGAFSISVLIALPLVGLIADKIQKKTLFITGACLMCFSTPLYAYIHGMGVPVFALRIIQGTGFACAFGITAAIVFENSLATKRRYLLGILTVSNISTHAIGPAFGEYIIHSYGFSLYFYSAGAFGFVACVAGLFLPTRIIRQARRPFSMLKARTYMAATMVIGAVFGSAVIFLPTYLLTRGISDSSSFFVAFVCGALVVWIFFYKILKRLGEKTAWVFTVVLMISLPAGISFITNFELLGLLSLLFGMGYGYLYPTLNALIIDAYPRRQGIANSLFVWSFNLGMLLASFGFGSISDTFGYQKAFFISALLGLFLLFMVKKLKES